MKSLKILNKSKINKMRETRFYFLSSHQWEQARNIYFGHASDEEGRKFRGYLLSKGFTITKEGFDLTMPSNDVIEMTFQEEDGKKYTFYESWE